MRWVPAVRLRQSSGSRGIQGLAPTGSVVEGQEKGKPHSVITWWSLEDFAILILYVIKIVGKHGSVSSLRM